MVITLVAQQMTKRPAAPGARQPGCRATFALAARATAWPQRKAPPSPTGRRRRFALVL